MDISTCGVCLESTSDAICCILPDILDDSLEDAHKFCSDCTEKYIEVATFAQPLAEKSMGFPCMELDCDRIIPYESFSGMINETTREHFLERHKREIEEQRREKTKEEHMKDEIEILQNQISKSLTLTCRACGVQYLKIDGCNVVKCRCGKKQCGLCGQLFESQFDSVHMNEKRIDYHSLTCQNKSLTELNKDIDSLALKYDLSTNQVHEYFPHRKNEDSNRRLSDSDYNRTIFYAGRTTLADVWKTFKTNFGNRIGIVIKNSPISEEKSLLHQSNRLNAVMKARGFPTKY